MATCLFCNEEIQDGAKKCRFCGEWLDPASTPARQGAPDPKNTWELFFELFRRTPFLVTLAVIVALFMFSLLMILQNIDQIVDSRVAGREARLEEQRLTIFKKQADLAEENYNLTKTLYTAKQEADADREQARSLLRDTENKLAGERESRLLLAKAKKKGERDFIEKLTDLQEKERMAHLFMLKQAKELRSVLGGASANAPLEISKLKKGITLINSLHKKAEDRLNYYAKLTKSGSPLEIYKRERSLLSDLDREFVERKVRKSEVEKRLKLSKFLRKAYSAKDPKEKIEYYKKAIELSPKYWRPYYSRARFYHRDKKYDQALADYDMAIELNSKYGWAFYYRGRAYEESNRIDQALADYNEVLKLSKKDARLINQVAYRLIDSGKDVDKGITYAKEALELKRGSAELSAATMDTIGWGYFKKNNYEEAVKWMKRAVKKRPNETRIKHLEQAQAKLKDAGG